MELDHSYSSTYLGSFSKDHTCLKDHNSNKSCNVPSPPPKFDFTLSREDIPPLSGEEVADHDHTYISAHSMPSFPENQSCAIDHNSIKSNDAPPFLKSLPATYLVRISPLSQEKRLLIMTIPT